MADHPVSVHESVRALFLALGQPERVSLSHLPPDLWEEPLLRGVHPVFDLTETFAPNDAGYTGGPTLRGGHLSVPCFVEGGGVIVLEISFHKGDTSVDCLTYPRDPEPVYSALYGLLEKLEVRD